MEALRIVGSEASSVSHLEAIMPEDSSFEPRLPISSKTLSSISETSKPSESSTAPEPSTEPPRTAATEDELSAVLIAARHALKLETGSIREVIDGLDTVRMNLTVSRRERSRAQNLLEETRKKLAELEERFRAHRELGKVSRTESPRGTQALLKAEQMCVDRGARIQELENELHGVREKMGQAAWNYCGQIETLKASNASMSAELQKLQAEFIERGEKVTNLEEEVWEAHRERRTLIKVIEQLQD